MKEALESFRHALILCLASAIILIISGIFAAPPLVEAATDAVAHPSVPAMQPGRYTLILLAPGHQQFGQRK